MMVVVVLLRRAPAPLIWATALACAVVTYKISAFYFSGNLV